MLDHPEKTINLIETLTAAAPFEVDLPPPVLAELRKSGAAIGPRQLVASVRYMGDTGGILCALEPEGIKNVIYVSLAHLQVRPNLPFAAAVQAYQKHRIKKLKKQQLFGL